jgi:hypothetical protein
VAILIVRGIISAAALLAVGMGVVISKRQVVRLLTIKLERFRVEDEAVLKAGLGGPYVTVDDTGRATPARAATPRRSAPGQANCRYTPSSRSASPLSKAVNSTCSA